MKSSQLTALAFLGTLATAVGGVEVVFEHLFTDADVPLPILRAQQDATPDSDLFDGTSLLDSYGGLERYDRDRLLLAVRENDLDRSNNGSPDRCGAGRGIGPT
mgnify:CR=1 FL=1